MGWRWEVGGLEGGGAAYVGGRRGAGGKHKGRRIRARAGRVDGMRGCWREGGGGFTIDKYESAPSARPPPPSHQRIRTRERPAIPGLCPLAFWSAKGGLAAPADLSIRQVHERLGSPGDCRSPQPPAPHDFPRK